MILLKKIGGGILLFSLLATFNIFLRQFFENGAFVVSIKIYISAVIIGILYGVFVFMIKKINYEVVAGKLSWLLFTALFVLDYGLRLLYCYISDL